MLQEGLTAQPQNQQTKQQVLQLTWHVEQCCRPQCHQAARSVPDAHVACSAAPVAAAVPAADCCTIPNRCVMMGVLVLGVARLVAWSVESRCTWLLHSRMQVKGAGKKETSHAKEAQLLLGGVGAMLYVKGRGTM